MVGDAGKALLEKIDTENINIWPEKDSIFVIDNVIVICMGSEEK